MPVPKRKTSKCRIRSRAANKGIDPKSFSACSNCKDPIVSHQVCKACGFYKGEKVMVTKLDRKVKRIQARKKTASPAESSEQPSE